MNKKSLTFSLGSRKIFWLIISLITAYMVYQYAKDNSISWLAFLSKAYLITVMGFIAIILGIFLLIIITVLIILLIAMLSGRSAFKTFYRKNLRSSRKEKKESDKVIIDADYEVKD